MSLTLVPVFLPYRLFFRDILKEPSITENVVNVKMLECRFDTSLTGLQAVPWGDGHLVFQVIVRATYKIEY